MEYIYDGMGENRARKKELIEFAKEEGLEFASGSDQVTEKALYPRLNSHIVDPLTEKGFVRDGREGEHDEGVPDGRGREGDTCLPAHCVATTTLAISSELVWVL